MMNRRKFIQGTAATSMFASVAVIPANNLYANTKLSIDPSPYHFQQTLDNTRQMPGFLMNFIVSKEQTNGAYALMEGKGRKGAEPPLHVHEYEDEAFLMLDGEMIVTIGDEDFHVKPGDYIFLPRQIAHTMRFLTETVHVTIMISPAGLEEYFYALSAPAKDFVIPPLPTHPPSTEIREMMEEMNKKFGITHP